jgi:hypothetical protein
VTHWHPRLDLVRLIEALSNEILAASDEEVRASATHGRTIASAAREIRLLVEAACADVDLGSIGPGAGPAGALWRPSHHQRH